MDRNKELLKRIDVIERKHRKDVSKLMTLIDNLTRRMVSTEFITGTQGLTLIDHEARLTDGNEYV